MYIYLFIFLEIKNIYVHISSQACSSSWCYYYLVNMSRAPKWYSPFRQRAIPLYMIIHDLYIQEMELIKYWSECKRTPGSFSGVRLQKTKEKETQGWVGGTGQGEKERDTRDKNDKKGNPGWRDTITRENEDATESHWLRRPRFLASPRGFRWLHPPFFSASPKTLSG